MRNSSIIFRKSITVGILALTLIIIRNLKINVLASMVPQNNDKVLICHVPPGNEDNPLTIEIDRNAWETGHDPHNSHDLDYLVTSEKSCQKISLTPTMTISPIPSINKTDHKISICHVPPGNPENAHVIDVDKHAWEEGHTPHNSHNMDYVITDDKNCPLNKISVTPKPTSEPKEHQDHKIYICHVPPGYPENAHVIDVDKHAWEEGHTPHNSHNMDYVVNSKDADCPLKLSLTPSLTPTITPTSKPSVTPYPSNTVTPNPTSQPSASSIPQPTASPSPAPTGQILGSTTLANTGDRVRFLITLGLFLVAGSQYGLYRLRKK
jgi:hypothetical protein